MLVGEVVNALNAVNARLGVGDSVAVFAKTQIDLQGASKFRKGMDQTYPTRAANALTFRTTFATSEANFAWQEVGSFNAATGPTMLTRLVTALGTKPATEAWQLTLTISVQNP